MQYRKLTNYETDPDCHQRRVMWNSVGMLTDDGIYKYELAPNATNGTVRLLTVAPDAGQIVVAVYSHTRNGISQFEHSEEIYRQSKGDVLIQACRMPSRAWPAINTRNLGTIVLYATMICSQEDWSTILQQYNDGLIKYPIFSGSLAPRQNGRGGGVGLTLIIHISQSRCVHNAVRAAHQHVSCAIMPTTGTNMVKQRNHYRARQRQSQRHSSGYQQNILFLLSDAVGIRRGAFWVLRVLCALVGRRYQCHSNINSLSGRAAEDCGRRALVLSVRPSHQGWLQCTRDEYQVCAYTTSHAHGLRLLHCPGLAAGANSDSREISHYPVVGQSAERYRRATKTATDITPVASLAV